MWVSTAAIRVIGRSPAKNLNFTQRLSLSFDAYIDSCLLIVADNPGSLAVGRHCMSIWIGQQDLPTRRGLNGDLLLQIRVNSIG